MEPFLHPLTIDILNHRENIYKNVFSRQAFAFHLLRCFLPRKTVTGHYIPVLEAISLKGIGVERSYKVFLDLSNTPFLKDTL